MRPKAYGRFFADAMFQKVKIGDNKQDSVIHPKKKYKNCADKCKRFRQKKKTGFYARGEIISTIINSSSPTNSI